MDVEGNTDLSSSLIKQRTVAEAQNSLFSVATWVDRTTAWPALGAPSSCQGGDSSRTGAGSSL